MGNAPTTNSGPAAALTSACNLAKSARLAYEEAVISDGVTATAWSTISEDLYAAASAMLLAGALAGFVEVLRARAFDAHARSQYAARMVNVARAGRVIDMSTLVSAS